MAYPLSKDQQAVLMDLHGKSGGCLSPAAVVDAARDPKSPIHSRFEWDDSAAAEQFRLAQARDLIRAVVIMVPEKSEPIQAFVSLREDREGDGGYRLVTTVLSEPGSRASLLGEALREIEALRQKYAGLRELAEVFEAAARVKTDVRVKAPKAKRADKSSHVYAGA